MGLSAHSPPGPAYVPWIDCLFSSRNKNSFVCSERTCPWPRSTCFDRTRNREELDRTLKGIYRSVRFARFVCNCLERAGSGCQVRLANSKADVPAYTAASWPEVGGGSRWESYACAMCVCIGEEKNLGADNFLRALCSTHSMKSEEATGVILCHEF